jgi:hypothetical protein
MMPIQYAGVFNQPELQALTMVWYLLQGVRRGEAVLSQISYMIKLFNTRIILVNSTVG